MNDTICAISTSLGVGAISIIRVSGSDAIKIVNSIFSNDLTKANSHTIHYGKIIDGKEIVDEVLVMLMKSPKTYTTEDIVEINSHGGVNTTNRILELLLKKGCRLAEPGEFTKRAFLNGRINLLESEAVNELINAKTDSQRKLSLNQIGGNLTKKINNIRELLLSLMANIEVNIDYPEYEDAVIVTQELIKEKIEYVESKIKEMIDLSKNGIIIKNGLSIALAGKPNVGKSSILNALLGEDKAIVTDIKGTTRDIVEGSILINGISVNLFDTAGIRETNEVVESIGIEKSKNKIKESDLVLFIIDSSNDYDKEDKEVLESLKDKEVIVVYNKNDLNKKEIKELENYDSISISSKNEKDIKLLKDKISEFFNLDDIAKSDYTYISNVRQISLLKKCYRIIEDIKKELKENVPVDLMELNIKLLWETLGEITGNVYKDELLDEIFSKFCLGK